jgi:cell division protein ZapA
MSQVSVSINGRQFRMACEDGQEDQLIGLARQLDQRIGDLRARFGEIGDARLTVMAALTLADELAEMAVRLKRAEDEIEAIKGERSADAARAKTVQAAVAAALNAAAERVEAAAKKLNSHNGGGNVALG